MKTSYFSNIRNIRVPLSISQHPPKWYTGPEYKVLAPPWKLVEQAHKGMSREDYTDAFYVQVLQNLDPRAEYDLLTQKFSDDVTLMCFEKLENPGDFCHRRIVADWFEISLGVKVLEWVRPPTIKSTLEF